MSKRMSAEEKQNMLNQMKDNQIIKNIPKFIPFNYDGTSQETKPYIEKVKPINDSNNDSNASSNK